MAIPNTTPTPNELYNGEMKKMSDTELRVVLVITRKTLGWEIDNKTGMRKKEDWINKSQLKKLTGRESAAISKAIDGCIEKNWIEARDKDGNILNTKDKRRRLGYAGKVFYRLGKIFLDKTTAIQKTNSNNNIEYGKRTAESEQQKANRNKRKRITKETYKQNNVVAKQSFAEKKFSFKETIDKMKKNTRKDIRIIALYWQFKNYLFDNKEQYQSALKRELRPAKKLIGYSDDRILETMEWLEENSDIAWKLETIHKMIDENLDNIEPFKKNKFK